LGFIKLKEQSKKLESPSAMVSCNESTKNKAKSTKLESPSAMSLGNIYLTKPQTTKSRSDD
jgi:hypothetical protein